jgi:hypothetical protein
MSNVKDVTINGQVPFDFWQAQGIQRTLSMLCGPSIGLRIVFSRDPIGSKPNSHGGETFLYDFTVDGKEAISTEGIGEMAQALVNAGAEITHLWVWDVENDFKIEVEVPQPTKDTQFVYELVIQIEDAGQEAFNDPLHQVQLKEYLDEALMIDLDPSNGRLNDWMDEASEDVTVSLALGRLSPRW